MIGLTKRVRALEAAVKASDERVSVLEGVVSRLTETVDRNQRYAKLDVERLRRQIDTQTLRLNPERSAKAATENAAAIELAAASSDYLHIAPGSYVCDPVYIENLARITINAYGVTLYPSERCAGQPLITANGTSLLVLGLQMISPDGSDIPALFSASRTSRRGSDPGIVFIGCRMFGFTNEAIISLRGSELVEFHSCVVGQDARDAAALYIEALGSTTRYIAFGGQFTNFGGDQRGAIRTRGNVQEVITFGTYFATERAAITHDEGDELNGVFMFAPRIEMGGSVVDADGWLDRVCIIGGMQGKEGDEPVRPAIQAPSDLNKEIVLLRQLPFGEKMEVKGAP